MTAFYLAPRFARREEMQGYKAELEARGHTVYGAWVDEPYPATETHIIHGDPTVGAFLALDDLRAIARSDTFVAFTELPGVLPNRGGRHVELGIAIARDMPVVIIGPRENVFHCLPDITVYATWAEFLETCPACNKGCVDAVLDSQARTPDSLASTACNKEAK